MESATQPVIIVSDADCPYCAGEEVVRGCADDVVLQFDCVCAGGNEEAVRWLLGKLPPREEQAIRNPS